MNIAVIGSGISGMVAAYLLSADHEVTMFEANDYIGGHTNTREIQIQGTTYAVDTGFIVCNAATYPNFLTLMKQLGITLQPSEMSFSVKCERTGLEYRPSTLNTFFIQRRNLVSPSFYRIILDILRFKRRAEEVLHTADDSLTLGHYLKTRRYSPMFIDYFIIPMGAAIWSTAPDKFMDFPARYFVQFFKNHGFLNIRQPQWLVIQSGSKSYIPPLTQAYRDRIRLQCPVIAVKRHPDHVEVTPKQGEPERFDQVVLATHSDQALKLLTDASEAEREILSAIPYQENLTILHTDTSLLPQRRAAWASWNYHIPREPLERVALTYDMNILQRLDAPVEFCVTLNRPHAMDAAKILHKILYHHPQYTPRGIAAQQRHAEISGVNRTHFCGAYWGYGFHEDGVNSALAVGKYFGKTL
ncbi:NAD(P)-binding protein [candidate division KSB3 bacterium]|uniref:NAD(P)-binding protein n=1 Tax=candidate division KSB3 bacterium TaxID=2044937 RepID=A0A9D5Q717_9BACT|nr:NAD(P)-binding protein [candidate division KSB3 bacterium]MBD3326385.1 NAD(P)-binding protein [candidate division KSB3 bacterium]